MEKYRDGQKELHCVFIDCEKVYDRVPRSDVWNCLRLKEVDEKYVRLIHNMHEGTMTKVKSIVGTTESFQVKGGLHQGSSLSPLLFAIVIDCMTEAVQRVALWDLMFADDVALNGESIEEVEERLEQRRRVMEDRGMKVSRQKTEYLCMGAPVPEREAKMQGVQINRVQEFKCLGCTVQSDGASEKEVAERIQAGWIAWRKTTGVLCDRKVPAKLKGRLFELMAKPAMGWDGRGTGNQGTGEEDEGGRDEDATIRTWEDETGQDSEHRHQEDNWRWRVGGEVERVQTKMARSCDHKRRRIRGKESEKNGGWKEKGGKTEKEMGGLCQEGYGGSGSDG